MKNRLLAALAAAALLLCGVFLGRVSLLRTGAVVTGTAVNGRLSPLILTPAEDGGETGDSKLDINRADAAQLEELPGIGETLARRITEYRDRNGAFSSIEEIRAVPGIGDGLYAKISDQICVTGEEGDKP